MTIFSARRRLAILWIVFFLLDFLILVVQSFTGFFEDDTKGVWKWFLPHTVPTITLILTVFSKTRRNPVSLREVPSTFLFNLCFIFSTVYLLLVTSLCLSGPMAIEQGRKPLDFLIQSNVWLISFQSLVAICIGWFFWKHKAKG